MRYIFGVLAGLSLSVSAIAEDGVSPRSSPEDDLDCALIFAHDLGKFYAEMSAEERSFYVVSYMYFVGRYEGANADRIGPAMAKRDELMQSMHGEELDILAQDCGIRIDKMKRRVGEYITLATEPDPAGGGEAGSTPKVSD